MNYPEIFGIVSGLLQFIVACYALRLNRTFGTTRVGWSLFSAFLMLTLAHVFLSAGPFRGNIGLGVMVNAVYAVTSLLLITGLAHLELMLKRRLQVERDEQRAQSAREAVKANEELQETAARLKAEVADRKLIQEQMEKTHRELVDASRKAGMSEVATGVLHNVGNVLNSVNVSAGLVADHLTQFKIDKLVRIAELLQAHERTLGDFMANDPRGQQLPGYLSKLAAHLSEERALMVDEIGFVKKKIDHIKEIVSTQQNYGRVSGLTEKVNLADLIEDVLRIQSTDLTQHKVQLTREYDPQVPEIIVDKHKVLQILLNLITNAKHACVDSDQTEKQVTVRVTQANDRVRVMMSDNGVGIPVDNLARIFNHGFTTRKKGGHGFGLHSGALAAKEMGGSLNVHSDGPGTGATFILELPLQPTKA